VEYSLSAWFGGRESRVCLAGELDLSVAGRLSELLTQALRVGSPRLVVDVADVTFMDCSILDVLLRGRQAIRRHGGELWLVAVPPRVSALLSLTGTRGLAASAEDPPLARSRLHLAGVATLPRQRRVS
jgi:anti-sigma B factor antagonist